MDRSPPDLDRETPDPLDPELLASMEQALLERHGAALAARGLTVQARAGSAAAVLLAVLPDGRRSHELFVFARGEGGLDRAVDYLDGLVGELAKKGAARRLLPLDWEGRPFDGDVVFVRGELRDYAAEEEAAKLLGEPPPPRGLDKPVIH
jgi:hypothetical protein